MLLTTLIIFVATLAQATLGFGLALIAMPFLTLTLGIRTAAPLVAFVGMTTGTIILIQDWQEVDLTVSWRLILSAVAGVPVGLWLLVAVPSGPVTRLLGALLIAYGLYQLWQPRLGTLRQVNWAFLFGFIAGLLIGAYNAGGPPVVIYGALRRWPSFRFRATLQGFFFPVGLIVIAGHGLTGLWTYEVLQLYLLSLPATLLATLLGGRFNRRIPAARFERLLDLALIVVGLLLLR